MAENVLILGAGFSHDAGIPLLRDFVDRMLDMAVRGKLRDQVLSSHDLELIREAVAIREELDGYHGRAVFDDRNIEDILSILAFNVLGGAEDEREKLNTFKNAIARTVELNCLIPSPQEQPTGSTAPADRLNVYATFWRGLFKWISEGNAPPDILTFNYDLVLERSLLQVLNGSTYNSINSPVPFNYLVLRYHHFPEIDQAFAVHPVDYFNDKGPVPGTATSPVGISSVGEFLPFNLLKLHGSLNFPRSKPSVDGDEFGHSIENPLMLPPIANKLSEPSIDGIWRQALLSLREARNVVFVGYSLPQTDLYMQYFLKAALGPNRGLNGIIVFDPALFESRNRSAAMRDRYLACFSEQMRKRIDFAPQQRFSGVRCGTTEHFADILFHRPGNLFF